MAAVYVADAGGRCPCDRRRCRPGCRNRAVADPIGAPALTDRDLTAIQDDLRYLARLLAGPADPAVNRACLSTVRHLALRLVIDVRPEGGA